MEPLGGFGGVPIAERENIEGFGQQCGEIVVAGANVNAAFDAPRLPQKAWLAAFRSQGEGQVGAQPKNCHFAIIGLTTTLGGLPLKAAGAVCEYDGCFDFVSVLSARTRATLPALVALGQQCVLCQRGGMWGELRHWDRTKVRGLEWRVRRRPAAAPEYSATRS